MRHSISVIGMVVLASVIAACTSSSSTPSPSVAPAVVDTAATVSATPNGVPSTTPAPPAAPTGVAMADMTPPTICPDPYGASCNQYKVSWTEANPEGVTMNVYVVTECLSKPQCVAPTTTLPAADLVLVGTVTASTGAAAFVVGDGESQGDGWLNGSGGATLFVYAVVVQAKTPGGTSAFVVAWSL